MALQPKETSLQWVPGANSPGIKQRVLPSCSEVKIGGGIPPLPQRDNFTVQEQAYGRSKSLGVAAPQQQYVTDVH